MDDRPFIRDATKTQYVTKDSLKFKRHNKRCLNDVNDVDMDQSRDLIYIIDLTTKPVKIHPNFYVLF